MPGKRKNAILPSVYTEKRVYYALQIRQIFSRLLRCQEQFSRLLFSENFYSTLLAF